MIKGIVALFTSGIFFHPMVLLGVVTAIGLMMKVPSETLYSFLHKSYIYIAMLTIAFIYTFAFAKVYKEGGIEVNKGATFIKAIGNALRLGLSFALTFAFVMSLWF